MKNKQQVIDFLTWLKWSSVMQISTLNSPIKFAEADWKSGIYFCWWLKQSMSKRCEDKDIWLKRYIAIDIDIRNDHYIKTGQVMDQDTLRQTIGEIVARLEVKWYNDYCAIVDSGNGVHFYWTGKEKAFDKEMYANGVKQLQLMINYIVSDLWYVCDPACTNLSRIMRLPWTINPRKKDIKEIKYDLWPIEAEILRFEKRDSETFESLELFAELYKEHAEKEKKEKLEAKREIKGTYKKWNDIRSEINSIPVGDIAEYVRWVTQTHDDGEIITLKERHKNMGAYVYKPYNVVYNQWSSLVKTDRKTFTPFELICFELMWWNQQETVKRFEEKYWIQIKKQPVKYEKLFSKIGYRYPWQDMENAFWCIVSGELVLIAAATNKGKTSFWLNILKQNKDKKVWLLNMEFEISDTFRFQFLRSKWYKDHEIKKIWTNLHPVSKEEEEIQEYIDKRMKEISTHNLPQNTDIDTVMEKLYSLWQEWYSMIMFDSLSSVKWWNTNEGQEEIVKRLRNFCTDTWIVVLLIHHFNKWGKTESGSQKISDLANVHINIHSAEDAHNIYYRVFILKKDKPHSKEVDFHWYMDLAWIYTEVPHWLQSNNFL